MRRIGYALLYIGLAMMLIGIPTCIGYCFVGLNAPDTGAPIGRSQAAQAIGGITLGAMLGFTGMVLAAIGTIVLAKSSYY